MTAAAQALSDQDIEVLAVVGADGVRPVVNLLVAPEQSDLLGLADSSARVRLALRNPRDDGRPEQATVQFESLYRAAKAPAKTPVKVISKAAPLTAGAK